MGRRKARNTAAAQPDNDDPRESTSRLRAMAVLALVAFFSVLSWREWIPAQTDNRAPKWKKSTRRRVCRFVAPTEMKVFAYDLSLALIPVVIAAMATAALKLASGVSWAALAVYALVTGYVMLLKLSVESTSFGSGKDSSVAGAVAALVVLGVVQPLISWGDGNSIAEVSVVNTNRDINVKIGNFGELSPSLELAYTLGLALIVACICQKWLSLPPAYRLKAEENSKTKGSDHEADDSQ